MHRILFVDDEPNVVEALRNLLRRHRHKWQMSFAASSAEALAKLEAEPVDVIVADLRMGGMDGVALLREVKERRPEVIRIILSGETRLEATCQALSVAHQFLAKPCDVAALERAVERAFESQNLTGGDIARRLVGRVDQLPSLPRLYSQLVDQLSDPRSDAEGVARVMQQDMGMCAKVLKLVNSAFFGLPERMTSIQSAVAYLGLNMVKSLVLSVEIFQAASDTRSRAFSIETLQSHAGLTAIVASRILNDRSKNEEVFIAGMLHDIGILVFSMQMPDIYEVILKTAKAEPMLLHEVEKRVVGVTHAEVGALLLQLWGIPPEVVEAVAHHHEPGQAPTPSFGLLTAVHVANGLVHELDVAVGLEGAGETPVIDLDYLGSIGKLRELEEWRRVAAAQSRRLTLAKDGMV